MSAQTHEDEQPVPLCPDDACQTASGGCEDTGLGIDTLCIFVHLCAAFSNKFLVI
jgi:hypothetical protein